MQHKEETGRAQGADQTPVFDWRKYIKTHRAAELFPLMKETDPAGFQSLVENIRVQGLIEPVVGWASNEGVSVLDGRNRLDALAQLGLLHETCDHHVGIKKWTGKEWSDRGEIERRIDGYDGAFRTIYEREGLDPYDLVLSLNVHRRHLNSEQKRDLIAKVLKAKPDLSNRQIGEIAKSDKNTVGTVRAEMEATGEIHQLKKTVGKDKKVRKKAARRAKEAKPVEGPGFEAARRAAQRLGRDLEVYDAGYLLTDPNSSPAHFVSLKDVTAALKAISGAPKNAAETPAPVVEPPVENTASDQADEPVDETADNELPSDARVDAIAVLSALLNVDDAIGRNRKADIHVLVALIREDKGELHRVRAAIAFAAKLGAALDEPPPDDDPPAGSKKDQVVVDHPIEPDDEQPVEHTATEALTWHAHGDFDTQCADVEGGAYWINSAVFGETFTASYYPAGNADANRSIGRYKSSEKAKAAAGKAYKDGLHLKVNAAIAKAAESIDELLCNFSKLSEAELENRHHQIDKIREQKHYSLTDSQLLLFRNLCRRIDKAKEKRLAAAGKNDGSIPPFLRREPPALEQPEAAR